MTAKTRKKAAAPTATQPTTQPTTPEMTKYTPDPQIVRMIRSGIVNSQTKMSELGDCLERDALEQRVLAYIKQELLKHPIETASEAENDQALSYFLAWFFLDSHDLRTTVNG